MTFAHLTATEIVKKIRAKEFTAKAVATAYLDRIKLLEPKIKAFNEVFNAQALKQAEAVDSRLAKGEAVGPLAGVPIAIKDNLMIRGEHCTCSSKILQGLTATYDATAIKKLRGAGAVFVGHTNLDEFAMGSSTENSAFGATRNPWDPERIPGGSSGGSAAAVAARMAPLALGSDTGGSIRQPAALCGVLGLKPTYGRVSRFGLIAFASSLDQIGPFAASAEDCALLLHVIAGSDGQDSTAVDQPVPDYAAELKKDLNGLRIGLPKEYFIAGTDKEIDKAVREALKTLQGLGATVKEISLPHTEYCLAVYYILAPSEASSNLSRFDGVRYGHRAAQSANLLELYEKSRGEGFGPEVKRRIMLGTYALSSGYYDAYYAKAQKVRTLIKQDFDKAFEQVDVIATPTSPSAAFKMGEKVADPLQMYLSDIFTISCNLAGLPGLSIPCGLTAGHLPIGLQLLGKPFDEATLLRVAHHYEQAADWNRRMPPVAASGKESARA
ncbi:MAG: aspartyl/glutamyl-tRNA amidotransferase subunit A [Elusimicrobia bacterium RIFCSPLOWO2_01_FULL_59_12]|nr:MAG: aspartyl/glutamyl-tRNA amidotransferase subunit A [Elusimicrobia bacterium RIFCSPLOWO2_01_FULL_59_12]